MHPHTVSYNTLRSWNISWVLFGVLLYFSCINFDCSTLCIHWLNVYALQRGKNLIYMHSHKVIVCMWMCFNYESKLWTQQTITYLTHALSTPIPKLTVALITLYFPSVHSSWTLSRSLSFNPENINVGTFDII